MHRIIRRNICVVACSRSICKHSIIQIVIILHIIQVSSYVGMYADQAFLDHLMRGPRCPNISPTSRTEHSETTHFLDQLLRNRVERSLILPERLDSELLVHLTGTEENGTTEFHPSLHDSGTIRANDPVEGRGRVLLGCFRRGIVQGDFVEAEANFRVGSIGQVIELVKDLDVGGRERVIDFQGLQEHDCAQSQIRTFPKHNRF